MRGQLVSVKKGEVVDLLVPLQEGEALGARNVDTRTQSVYLKKCGGIMDPAKPSHMILFHLMEIGLPNLPTSSWLSAVWGSFRFQL